MEEQHFDLPTLHRPSSREGNPSYPSVLPIPTPPHHKNTASYSYYGSQSPGSPAFRSTLPNVLTEKNWRVIRAKKKQNAELPDDSDFEDSYRELSSKIAYRYPHPGMPRKREGSVGGTWRNIKEAIGYGPGRLMWVDGIITLYDEPTSLNKERPWSSVTTSSYNIHPHRFRYKPQAPSHSYRSETEKSSQYTHKKTDNWHSSNMPQPLLFANCPPQTTAPIGKFKGFYSMSQTYA